MNRNIPTDKVIVSRERILRAVASSSAIETGERGSDRGTSQILSAPFC
ncbi:MULTISPECIES: hypothetical protein [Halomonadaceae]|uniref:Uncharacterized protein n=2 Tax=Vreelandella TaxID=3137766 RepID=A0A7Z0LVE1_9GAMM|nr:MULTISPECIES: hypothetical protein [Halomonas]NYS79296.1 hypothetical protein [Halomonas glaciei]|tara:strand:+ start:156 stop:299 length:144 start_codon:yes stop_codon:yes gene_type:complete